MHTLYGTNQNKLTNLLSSDSIKSVHHPEVTQIHQEPETEYYQVSAIEAPNQDFQQEIVTACEASSKIDGQNGLDIRPRVHDKNTDRHTLLDSGSQVSVVRPAPGDSEVTSIKLESVNGQKIKCFGKKKISIKLCT